MPVSAAPTGTEQIDRANATGLTPVVFVHGRHALTIDSGWREVADTALAFIRRFVQ